MARRSTGGVVERQTSRGTTRADAERELRYTLEQVRRGEWKPPAEIEPPRSMPTFHEFASAWYARREHAGLRPRTLEHLRWCLTDHLLPTFRAYPLDKIDAEAI